MNIDYNAVMEILKNFLENEKTEILGISVGEERQVRDAIRNLLTAYEEKNKELEKEKEKNKELNKLKGFEMLDIFNMGKQSSRQRIEFDYVSKEKLKELKEFYIKDCKDKNMTLITLENLVKNINILLDIGGIKQC